jgi:mono/diheme cytochrome c family protein
MPVQWPNICGIIAGRFAARHTVRYGLAALALAASAPGAFADDAGRGQVIARRWCAACHVVASDQTSANADAPTFASIARKKQPLRKLKAFLTNPHPKMPDMNLTRSEIADIVAYIGSLDR